MQKLACVICKEKHDAKEENFPMRRVQHQKVKTRKGYKTVEVIVYACLKCAIKIEQERRGNKCLP